MECGKLDYLAKAQWAHDKNELRWFFENYPPAQDSKLLRVFYVRFSQLVLKTVNRKGLHDVFDSGGNVIKAITTKKGMLKASNFALNISDATWATATHIPWYSKDAAAKWAAAHAMDVIVWATSDSVLDTCIPIKFIKRASAWRRDSITWDAAIATAAAAVADAIATQWDDIDISQLITDAIGMAHADMIREG